MNAAKMKTGGRPARSLEQCPFSVLRKAKECPPNCSPRRWHMELARRAKLRNNITLGEASMESPVVTKHVL